MSANEAQLKAAAKRAAEAEAKAKAQAAAGKKTDEDEEAAHDLAESQAEARRTAEIVSDAVQDPKTMVEVRFNGGVSGRAKHHVWDQSKAKGELPIRRVLKKGNKLKMTRKQFASVKDRFDLVRVV